MTAVSSRRRCRCLNRLPHTDPVNLDQFHGTDACALLDPEETKPGFHPFAAPDPETSPWRAPAHFDTSGSSRHRRAVWSAFQRLGMPNYRIAAFEDCGQHPWIAKVTGTEDEFVVCSNRCRDRFCPNCSRLRASTIAENLHRWIKDRRCRFLTLTLKGGVQPLHVQLRRLYDSFRRLRETVLWKRCVRGGAAFLEIKIGKHSGMWHPHLHCIVEGKYIDIRELKPTWERITNGSHQVDIRDIRDRSKVASYVTKYVSKPFDHDGIKGPEQLDELLNTISGTRAALTWGTWRGLRLTAPIDDKDYTYIMSLAELERRANALELDAVRIWNALMLRYERPERLLPIPDDVLPHAPPTSNAPTTLFDVSWHH